jgi:hypothetical protein
LIIQKTLALVFCAALCACQSVQMPRGKSAGYKSARFVQVQKNPFAGYSNNLENSPELNQMVKNAIAKKFQAEGIPVVQGDSDLIIAHLILRQENISTTRNQEYFGYGRDASAIMDEAHERGVLNKSRPDAFDEGAVVIDILDARTNKLIYRNFAKGAVAQGISDAARQARLNSAVAGALAPFFR